MDNSIAIEEAAAWLGRHFSAARPVRREDLVPGQLILMVHGIFPEPIDSSFRLMVETIQLEDPALTERDGVEYISYTGPNYTGCGISVASLLEPVATGGNPKEFNLTVYFVLDPPS